MSAAAARRTVAAALAVLAVLAASAVSVARAGAQQTPPPSDEVRNPLAVPSRTPPVRVTLSAEDLLPGDRVRVRVRTRSDGYLVVLHADPGGRVRVLFPLDPADDQRVRGGSERTLEARDGGESFVASSAIGDGAVLAAVAATPFRVAAFARAGHWDVRAFPRLAAGADAEGELVAVVGRMRAGGARFDYDAAPYRVRDELPVVSYGNVSSDGDGEGYAGHPQSVVSSSMYYDDYFSYGFPYFPYFAGSFHSCLLAGRHAVLVGVNAGCFAGHGFRPHGRRRGGDGKRDGGDLSFPGNPNFGDPRFGDPRSFGTVEGAPRAIGRRPGALPPSANGGGIVFRSRAPQSPRAPLQRPAAAGAPRTQAPTVWMTAPPPPAPAPRAAPFRSYDVRPAPAPAPPAAPATAPPAAAPGGMVGVPASPLPGRAPPPPPRRIP